MKWINFVFYVGVAITGCCNASDDEKQAREFARCDGVLESAFLSGQLADFSADMQADNSRDFKRAALIADSRLSLSDYREARKVGLEQYGKQDKDSISANFILGYCLKQLDDAMLLIEVRGK